VLILVCIGAYVGWRRYQSSRVDLGALSYVITNGLAAIPTLRAAAMSVDALQSQHPDEDDSAFHKRLCQLSGDSSWSLETVRVLRGYPGGAAAFVGSLERRYTNARDALEHGDVRRSMQILETIESESRHRESLQALRNSENKTTRKKRRRRPPQGVDKPGGIPDSLWVCPKCSSMNQAAWRACETCYGPRPSWVCPKCSSTNQTTWRTCDTCFAPRPGR
jgi:hypothetical protein